MALLYQGYTPPTSWHEEMMHWCWLIFGCGLSGTPDVGPPTQEPVSVEQPYRWSSNDSLEVIKANRLALEEQLLSDPDPHRRAQIAAALGYTAHEESSLPAIAHALSVEQDVNVQLRLVAVLLGYRPAEALDAVVLFALGDVDPSIHAEVLTGLEGADPDAVAASIDAHAPRFPEKAESLRQAVR